MSDGEWLLSYSAWLRQTRGEDPIGVYVPLKHYSVDGHALCNRSILLVEDSRTMAGFRCQKCLKKLEKMKR